MDMFEWLDGAIAKIKEAGAGKVLVQAPEGLKTSLLDVGSALENAGIKAVLSCEPCFGACDLRDAEAERLGCGLVLHIGHASMGLKTRIPVIYEEYPMKFDVSKLSLGNALDGYGPIGLATSVQYIGMMGRMKQMLESKGKKAIVGKPSKAMHEGQILGCDQSATKSIEQKVDAFLFFGTGRFHAIGVAEAVSKPVFFLDLESGKIVDLKPDMERRARIRAASIEKAKGCKRFGVLVSTKQGQGSMKAAEDAVAKLRGSGKEAWLLAMDMITPEKLLGLKLDCLVNCACPRLSEDTAQFRKPIIGPEDLGTVLG